MKVVILAGGKGTRLGVKGIPKPMVEVGGKPILEHQILLALRYGLREIIILSSYRSEVIKDYFGDGRKWGANISHVVEDVPLGTAGAVKAISEKIDDAIMVFYGDTIMDVDLISFINFHRSKGEKVQGSIFVHPNDHPYDSDLLECDHEGQIIAFYPKPHSSDEYRFNIVSAALYILEPGILDYIESGTPSDFGKDIFPKVLKDGQLIYAYKSLEYIKDMGTPERMKKVEVDLLDGKVKRMNNENKRKAIFLDRDGVINCEVGNLNNVGDFELIPCAAEAIRLINQSEYCAIVVTNQPSLAKGFMTQQDLDEIHRKMDSLLGESRSFVDAVYYCPHHPEAGFEGEVVDLKVDCECRKPKPGMLMTASRDWNISLEDSFIIGDRFCDIAAGKRAGVGTILVETGFAGSDQHLYRHLAPDRRSRDLLRAVTELLASVK